MDKIYKEHNNNVGWNSHITPPSSDLLPPIVEGLISGVEDLLPPIVEGLISDVEV